MNKQKKETLLDRRNMLISTGALGLGALAAVAAPGTLIASASEPNMHMQHGRKNKVLVDAITDCVKASEACIVHCLDIVKSGDTTLIDCQRSAQETAAFCRAHAFLAADDSAYLHEMCELGIKLCGNCDKECKKHEKKHALCKACGEACVACVKECKRYLKA